MEKNGLAEIQTRQVLNNIVWLPYCPRASLRFFFNKHIDTNYQLFFKRTYIRSFSSVAADGVNVNKAGNASLNRVR